jgi:hypothetical protein
MKLVFKIEKLYHNKKNRIKNILKMQDRDKNDIYLLIIDSL